MNEPAPAISTRDRKHRICSVVQELTRPFPEEQRRAIYRLDMYALEHHQHTRRFYTRLGGAVADAMVKAGRLNELVDFEQTVYQRSLVDLEDAYRYYRDQFIAFYDSVFPGASGPYIDEARQLLIQEMENEVYVEEGLPTKTRETVGSQL